MNTHPAHHQPKLRRFSIAWILLVHFFGIIGVYLGFKEMIPAWFLPLTPLVLVSNALLILARFERFRFSRVLAFLLVAVLSFGIEVYGVQSGNLFGEYTYGNNLGWKMWGVPLVIGLNWASLLVVMQQVSTYQLKIHNRILSAMSVAAMMTIFDLLLEMLAPMFDFWNFTHRSYAPTQNFVAWFAVSFLFALFGYSHFRNPNKTAVLYGVAQVVFFTVLGLLLI